MAYPDMDFFCIPLFTYDQDVGTKWNLLLLFLVDVLQVVGVKDDFLNQIGVKYFIGKLATI